MKFPQPGQPADAVRDGRQPIVGHPQLNQAGQVCDDLRDGFEFILPLRFR